MITITFVASEEELISGIPRTVEITTSRAATVYYTTDGTLPTPFSAVYTGVITMPTDVGTITLSAIAYYIDDSSNLVPSPVLSETYSVDQSDLDRHRLMFFEGVVYIYPGGEDIPFYYDADGELTTSIDIEASELLFTTTDRDNLGNHIEPELAVAIMPPEETPQLLDNTPPVFSSPNDQETFNPEARMIFIDGRAGASEQQLTLINGPHMSMRNMQGSYGGVEFFNIHGTNYVSGTSTRIQFNRERGVVVFNYWDSNSGKWVKSVQDLPPAPEQTGVADTGTARVIPWVQWGRQKTV